MPPIPDSVMSPVANENHLV
ncbi:hypothetical protein F383_31025 [Gossypium arboreum]|uniref:Uncharacterized protein n=1 Tax=Gossypium arboreum TaxID=29729 RepID=A0A0B0PIC3_GOSAR|nr:hypothetical protein F383_31025 [Gossypium arboreum]